jgi:hypothetical protein
MEDNLDYVYSEFEIETAKEEFRKLYIELLSFKDKSEFHYNGFAVGHKYNRWLTDVEKLSNTPSNKILLKHGGFVYGDLEMLGFEYLKTYGKDNEYSRWVKKLFDEGINK